MSTVLTPAPQTKTISSPDRRPVPRSGSPRRRTPTDPSERRIWLILLGTLTLAAFCVAMFLQQPRFRHTNTPISEIQLGANVPGSNPSEADDLTFGDSIDPDSWKMVRLTAQQGDGTLVEISLLRPDSWLAERNAVPGSVVDGLEFGRLGVVGDATVETIAPCPPIRPGPGRTVTGIYKHFGQKVLDLRTANGEEIGVTPDHRFWSADRREFVQAGDLKQGETLNLLDGTTTVSSITPRPSGEPVYTLEVHVEHVFHVAKSGVLVHNCNGAAARATRLGGFTDPNERAVAEYLEDLGHKVTKNTLEGVEGAGRQGDAFVNGIKHEFKALDPGPTANTIKNVVNNSIRKGGQAREIIIDARGTGLTEEIAKEGTFKALGISRGKLDGLTIIGDDFFFRFTPR